MSKHLAEERPYESILICPSDVPQAKLDSFLEKVKSAVTESKGTVRSVQNWGRRRLTYPIKHHKEGQYIYVDFNGSNSSVQALTGLYRVTDFVLRYMTVDREEAPPPPAPKPTEATAAATADAAAAAQSTTDSKEVPSVKKEG